ncbi:MAG: Do family serine endopeptidase [Muribaculaceae bacterium]|nr:Do family serine endopeptidase [Muribaculaceae bacterium]
MKQNFKSFLLGGACVLAGGAATFALSTGNSTAVSDNNTGTESEAGSIQATRLSPGRVISQDDFTRAAEETVNGVVSVKSYVYANPRNSGRGQQQYYDPFFEFFFGPQPRQRQMEPESPKSQQPRQVGLGSGVIINKDGYIVTNNHVIDQAERLEVTLNDNRNYEATVVGSDPITDLALIKIEVPAGESLHVIPLGNSEALHLGEWVLAVGNPFGFTSTVTSGIVSAKARNISTTTGTPSKGNIESYIQTDAAVNQGNSGGALVNLRGELVGINTAIYSQTGAYAGCSFAIPVSIVQKVVEDLKSFGTVQRAYLGIRFVELTPELIQQEGIKGTTKGIYVGAVEDRSAAFEAGLKEGDIITSISGIPTGSTAELQEAITRFSPGDTVEVNYLRDGEARKTRVTLRNASGTYAKVSNTDKLSLGATFGEADAEILRRLELSGGVAVSDVNEDGLLGRAGVRDGLIILAVNNVRVKTPEDLEKIVKMVRTSSEREKALFITGVYPSGKTSYFAVDLAE